MRLNKKEVNLIRGALSAQAVVVTAFGKNSFKDLEAYRELMNLSDKIREAQKCQNAKT